MQIIFTHSLPHHGEKFRAGTRVISPDPHQGTWISLPGEPPSNSDSSKLLHELSDILFIKDREKLETCQPINPLEPRANQKKVINDGVPYRGKQNYIVACKRNIPYQVTWQEIVESSRYPFSMGFLARQRIIDRKYWW